MKFCKCGCQTKIPEKDNRGRYRTFALGHSRKGLKLPDNHPFKNQPRGINAHAYKMDSKSRRTLYWRSRQRGLVKECNLKSIGGCSKRIEVHHRDKNIANMSIHNLQTLCSIHHRLIHLGRIDPLNPIMPSYYIDGGGKRRYV